MQLIIERKYIDKLILSFIIISIFAISCKKLVEIEPPITGVTGANVYASDATAAAVLTGLYTKITPVNNSQASLPFVSIYAGLSADELALWSGITSGNNLSYYKNILGVATGGSEMWSFIYPNVFTCNSAIEQLTTATSLTSAVRQQLLGEAKFMRALLYFYLVNLYGDVPLVLSTNYTSNALMARSPKEMVYQQIINDSREAQNLLSANYLDATLLTTTTDRLRPTKWAACALLSRVYLYTGNWGGADSAATALISSSQYSLVPLAGTSNVFAKNSPEAIWQLQPINVGWNTELAKLFIIPSTGPSGSYWVYLSNSLLSSFETGDKRKTFWIHSVTVNGNTYYYPYKYTSATLNATVSEYYMVLRLGEQYLIRAEARAQENNIIGSQNDLDTIRARAGLTNTGAGTKIDLLTAIQHERQVELFTEWGHRWLDLKRMGAVDSIMQVACALKGTVWNTYQQLYPILLADLQEDINLKQNPGY